MRNSVLPLFGVMSVLMFALLALRGDSQPGLHGPDIFPGIFRLPKKDKFPIISAPLKNDTKISAEGAIPLPEAETWRVVVISALDRAATTRAVVLSLAEKLARHGSVTIVDPVETDVFPMGCDRIMTVATENEQNPKVLGEEGAATVLVTTRLARLPNGHPADLLQRDPGGPVHMQMTINQRSRADGVIDGWPQWWAGFGRSIADSILTHIAPQGLPPVSDPETRRWLPSLLPRSDWGTPLALQPTTEHLQWDFAFQEDLVRGWVGHITGMQVTTKRSGEQPAELQLQQRMTSGSWESAGAPGVYLYTRKDTHGVSEWFSFSPLPQQIGWSVTWWQERPKMAAVFEQLDSDATKGDLNAQRLLYAYRACPNMPTELRERAAKPVTPQTPVNPAPVSP
jgi:hypothetical protein